MRAVVDAEASLVLPLMHHLVEEGVENCRPPVTPSVASTDHDQPGIPGRRHAVVPQPAPQAPRYLDANGSQRAPEALCIQLRVPGRQLLRRRCVLFSWGA